MERYFKVKAASGVRGNGRPLSADQEPLPSCALAEEQANCRGDSLGPGAFKGPSRNPTPQAPTHSPFQLSPNFPCPPRPASWCCWWPPLGTYLQQLHGPFMFSPGFCLGLQVGGGKMLKGEDKDWKWNRGR